MDPYGRALLFLYIWNTSVSIHSEKLAFKTSVRFQTSRRASQQFCTLRRLSEACHLRSSDHAPTGVPRRQRPPGYQLLGTRPRQTCMPTVVSAVQCHKLHASTCAVLRLWLVFTVRRTRLSPALQQLQPHDSVQPCAGGGFQNLVATAVALPRRTNAATAVVLGLSTELRE